MNNTIATWRKTKELHSLLGKSGHIVVWTRVYVAPEGFTRQVPYIVAIIDFGKEGKKTLPVVDYDEEQLQVGQKVITVVRRVGFPGKEDVITYGIKVTPV
jgi:uncharacterized OB-fold protein